MAQVEKAFPRMENLFTHHGRFGVRLDSVLSIGGGKVILQAVARDMRIAASSPKADGMKRKFIFGTLPGKERYPMKTSGQPRQPGTGSLLECSDVVGALRRIVKRLHAEPGDHEDLMQEARIHLWVVETARPKPDGELVSSELPLLPEKPPGCRTQPRLFQTSPRSTRL